MFASFNDVFKGKSLREKKVPDVTLKYLSNNLPNPDCYENILSKAKFPQDYLE